MLWEVGPKANPDFELLYSEVRWWYLEVDGKGGRVIREIGFQGQGKPIVVGPFGRNYGVWTDSPPLHDWSQFERIGQAEFDRCWKLWCVAARAP
jgi:hypothetical protein